MNTMSLFESGDSSGKISLEQLCNGTLQEQMLDETSLCDLAYYIVRGGWPENISTTKDNAHLMPRSYMETIIEEDLNRFDLIVPRETLTYNELINVVGHFKQTKNIYSLSLERLHNFKKLAQKFVSSYKLGPLSFFFNISRLVCNNKIQNNKL